MELLQKVGELLLDVDGSSISPSMEVCNLGDILDSMLSFQSHIKSITKSAFYHLKNISRLRPSLNETWVSDSCVTAPTHWNTLPAEIRKLTSLETFKRDLKTHLFSKDYQL